MSAAAVPTILVLKRARKIVADKRTWTTGEYARDVIGKLVLPTDLEACQWCATGAVVKAGHELGLKWDECQPLLDALTRIASPMSVEGYGLEWVNDMLGRKAALKVIDAAIAEVAGV